MPLQTIIMKTGRLDHKFNYRKNELATFLVCIIGMKSFLSLFITLFHSLFPETRIIS